MDRPGWHEMNGGTSWQYHCAAMQIGGWVIPIGGKFQASLHNYYRSDGSAVSETFPTRDEAMTWIENLWWPARRRAGLETSGSDSTPASAAEADTPA